ncbi:MAG TPA: flagellar biosynthesis protein FlhB [Papillibacter sp.]|jgi:flagellar biosynthetic protein FlhB|nr:flagellar biosynthesis protein FlhB [Papillibacter sp.]
MAQGSGEKTEKASDKKRKDVKKKGETHKSMDLCSSVMLLVTFGAIYIGYEGFIRSMRSLSGAMLDKSFIVERAANLTSKTVVAYYKDILFAVLPIVLPFFAVCMVAGALVHVAQTGPMFITEKLKPDFKKINPISGFKRIFSMRAVVDLIKAVAKVIIIAVVAKGQLEAGVQKFLTLMYVDVGGAFLTVLSTCLSMGILIGVVLVAFAAADMLYQWWRFEKDIMMTKQEVKEEHKQLEGNPQTKGRIRSIQRKMSAARMMKNVPDSTVVVTNPDHYAVALRYRENEDTAPVVVAKGVDFLAQRIKKIANENKVAIVENKPVARALYAACEVGDEIPPELYQAVADILIYVYRLNK